MCRSIGSPRSRQLLLLLAFSAMFGVPSRPAAAGQQIQASIVGQVKDESGSVLPGVTVTATSPSLQVPSVTDVTNERGEYRLTPLPIGVYEVVYTLAGFQTLKREGLQLPAGFVAKEDVVLNIGALSESVTVSGASPVVDVTTTAIVTQFTRQTLELAPTSRNGLWSLLTQLPSVRNPNVDVGGITTTNPSAITKYGQLGEDFVMLEGVASQGAVIDNWGGIYIDYASLEEVRTEVIGGDASAPRKGLKMAMITKSGGNDFHGAYSWGYTSDRFQGTNLTDALKAQGITNGPKTVHRNDVSGDLGGRVIRDSLWFYGAARRTNNIDIPLGAVMPDGSPAKLSHMLRFASAKGSYQATLGNRFVVFDSVAAKDDTTMTQFTPYESRSYTPTRRRVYKGEWQGVRGNGLTASVQYGVAGYHINRPASSDKPSTSDAITSFRTGDNASSGSNSHLRTRHTKATLNWYQPQLFAGNHGFQIGFDYMDSIANYGQISKVSGDYTIVYRSGVPFQLQTVNAPVAPNHPVHNLDLYAGDSWAVSQRLTLNVGLRFAHDHAFVPAQCRPAGNFVVAGCFPAVQLPDWTSLAPRLHAAYDLGAGKTVIKGGWARYNQMRGNDEIALADRTAKITTTWTWHDLNGDRLYNPGEVDLNPNSPDFVSTAGSTNLVPNPSEIQPKTDEVMLALEREIMPNFGIRAAGIYHRAFDRVRLQNNLRPYSVYNIAITNPDPGPDGRVGTADDPGTRVTYFDYPTSFRGASFVQTSYVNDPSATQSFKSLELSATKRLSDGWQLMASYSATKKNIPYVTNTGGGNDYPLTTLDPNAEINAADRTWDWQGNVIGAYVFPHAVMASVNFQYISGFAFGRTVLFSGGQVLTTQVVRVEPIGTRRLDNIKLVDLRTEKSFRLSNGHKVAIQVNLYNLLNAATVSNVSDRSGPTFLVPVAGRAQPVLNPRIFTFNFSYAF